MATCIYCRNDSSGTRGEAHIFPQALAMNDGVLPLGTVCDPCNEYAGKRLDSTLIRYPQIAWGAQFIGTAGKRGKPRQELGGIGRTRTTSESFRLTVQLHGKIDKENDALIVNADLIRHQFDFGRFRRALHHIAFNFLAAAKGAEAVLSPRYDPVRQYIRKPPPNARPWPYGQLEPKLKRIPRLLEGRLVDFDGAEVVALQIFQLGFIVDLEQSGILAAAVDDIGALLVDSDVDEPPPARLTIRGKVS